jgi:hypothetical protein
MDRIICYTVASLRPLRQRSEHALREKIRFPIRLISRKTSAGSAQAGATLSKVEPLDGYVV